MDSDSPFARFEKPKLIESLRTIHVNFCGVCHYVWKAPAAATTCINCKGNGDCAWSLISYKSEVQIL